MVSYFSRPIRTGMNLYKSRELVGELTASLNLSPTTSISTSANEIEILSTQKTPRKSAAYKDVLSREPSSPIVLTDTVLRVPRGRPAEKYEIIHGRKIYPRILVEHGREQSDVLVPE